MRRLIPRLLASVRVRVTATALLAVGCALAVAAVVVDANLRSDRQRFVTSTAQEQAREVVSLNPDLSPPLFIPVDLNVQTGLVQVVRDGRVIGASRPLRHVPALWSPGQPTMRSLPVDYLLGVAADVRSVAVPVTSGKVHATVVVVISLDQYDHSIVEVQKVLEVGGPILLLVVGLICWLIVGRALRPIEMMRREVAEVASVRGGHRVAEPANDDEVGRLARTLNSMLDRIEASADRERRFVSDASHELRSPIANIRTGVEVALHHPGAADWPQVGREVLEQNERMEGLVSGLLLLARSDEGSLLEATEPTDLAEVVEDLVSRLHGPPPVAVHAEEAPITVPSVYAERMVANLVDNARRFAETQVSLSVGRRGAMAELRVRDDGPGVPEADRRRIFERFVRLDEARDRGEGGFGLGLAIVADLSRFYGGTVEVRPADPGAEFVLTLPLWSAERGAPAPVAGRRVG